MKTQNKFINNSRGGFTLVETLVAVTILVIGTLGPIAIAAQGIASAGYAKDQITAYYLAQEGIEFVRNIRDSNALQGLVEPNTWLTGLESCDGSGERPGCYVEVQTSAVNTCSSGKSGCPFLTLDESDYYGYGGKVITPFKRTIQIKPGASDDVETVTVIMNWSSHGNARSFTLGEDIYNSN